MAGIAAGGMGLGLREESWSRRPRLGPRDPAATGLHDDGFGNALSRHPGEFIVIRRAQRQQRHRVL